MKKSHHVSVRAELYAALVRHLGEPNRRGRISRTVDQLINDYIDKQEQKQDGN